MKGPFVTTIDLKLKTKLREDLEAKGFSLHKPAHSIFSARGEGVSLTLYTSGKLVVQGKAKDDFIQFYLEPEILKSFAYSHPTANIDSTPRIGVDEAGKGDFFGPLCVAALYASEKDNEKLIHMGMKDSKKLSDTTIRKLAPILQKKFAHKIILIYPQKYNELYAKFKNLNSLLAWGHATAIDHLVKQTNCSNVIIDKFAHERVVESALSKKNLTLNLTQVHRGEEDPVVAAASILARFAFIDALDRFDEKYNFTFPKGASKQVIEAGKKFIEKFSRNELGNIAKLHFKTTLELN